MEDKIVLAKPSVKLLNYDSNWMKYLTDAWIKSRPMVDPKSVNIVEILNIDTPVNELASVQVEIDAPIYIRDILFNDRTHHAWATTSRNAKSTGGQWVISSKELSVFDKYDIEQLHDKMTSDKKLGLSQDEFRKHLPISSMTSWTQSLDIRSLIKIYKYLEELNTKFLNTDWEYSFSSVLEDWYLVVIELLEQVMTHEEIVEFLNKSRSSKLVNTYHYQSESFFTGNILGINITIPLSLYAQLIRHRPLMISSNLLTDKFSVSTPISGSIDVFVVGTMDTWKHILGHRLSWISQSNLWSIITDEVAKVINISQFMMDPSKPYPYAGDNYERLNGKDPGVPDPIHVLQLNNEEFIKYVNPGLVSEMIDYVIETNRPKDYWIPLIDKIVLRMSSLGVKY